MSSLDIWDETPNLKSPNEMQLFQTDRYVICEGPDKLVWSRSLASIFDVC